VKSIALDLPRTAGGHRRGAGEEQPLRLLLVRERLGELPWLVKSITSLMAPVDVVQVGGLANALWRLGRERFDSVLLDLDARDRATVRAWRQHIAEVDSIPVLELNGDTFARDGAEPPAGRPGRPGRLPKSGIGSRNGVRRAPHFLRAV
jgi:hypothetical protein